MKRRLTVTLVIVMIGISLIIICAMKRVKYIEAQSNDMESISKYSETLSETAIDNVNYSDTFAKDGDVDSIVEQMDEEGIYEVGKDIVITVDEIEQYTEFYELNESDNPKEDAVKYAEERNALYAAAINNGYTVSDKELKEKIAELKSMLKEDDNRYMYEQALNGFESEDDYWAFEYEVYKVDIPIEKYVEHLGTEFREENDITDDTEFNELWTNEFEKIKRTLVENENFSKN